MEVVEHFHLVLYPQPPNCERKVVLKNVAKVGIRVCDSELVPQPAGEQAVAAQADIEIFRDRAGGVVGD